MQQIHFSSGIPVIEAALQIFPDSVAHYIQGLLPDPITSSGVLPVAVIAALWSSSMGMVAIIKGLDHIFDVEETLSLIHISCCYLLRRGSNASRRPSPNRLKENMVRLMHSAGMMSWEG